MSIKSIREQFKTWFGEFNESPAVAKQAADESASVMEEAVKPDAVGDKVEIKDSGKAESVADKKVNIKADKKSLKDLKKNHDVLNDEIERLKLNIQGVERRIKNGEKNLDQTVNELISKKNQKEAAFVDIKNKISQLETKQAEEKAAKKAKKFSEEEITKMQENQIQKMKAYNDAKTELDKADEKLNKERENLKKTREKAKNDLKNTVEKMKKQKKAVEKAADEIKNASTPEEAKKAISKWKTAATNLKRISNDLIKARTALFNVKKLSLKSAKAYNEAWKGLNKSQNALKEVGKIGESELTKLETIKGIKQSSSSIKALKTVKKGGWTGFALLAVSVAVAFIASSCSKTGAEAQMNSESNQNPTEPENASTGAEQATAATDSTASTGATTEAAPTDETGNSGEDTIVEEANNAEAEVEADTVYTVKKGDNLWNIVKKLLKDKNNEDPTDTEIANGVRRLMAENGLKFSEKGNGHYYVMIKPDDTINYTSL